MISREHLKEVLSYDPKTGIFKWRVALGTKRLGSNAGYWDVNGYLHIRIFGKPYRAARLAYYYMVGKWPRYLVDHKNGNPSDNRWRNLREATCRQNTMNQCAMRDNICGWKGVTKRGKYKRYRARIIVNGKEIHIGMFATAKAAHAAYIKAAKKHFGEFARAS